MATVLIRVGAQKQFEALPMKIQARMLEVFERLAAWPNVAGVKSLKGSLSGHFRIRTGDYRVQFTVNAKGVPVIVMVEKVGHRDGFYDD